MHDSPATWERLAEKDPARLAKYPPVEGLERWERDAFLRLEAEQRGRRDPLSLDDVAKLLAPHLPASMGTVERDIVGVLALSLWGEGHVDAVREQRRRRAEDAPLFGSLAEVLHVACYGEPELGRGQGGIPRVALDKARANPARIGYDYCAAKQSRSGPAADPRASSAVDRRIDARRALAASLLGPTEVLFLVHVYIGELTKWSKREGGQWGKLEKRKRAEIAAAYRAKLCVDAAMQPGAQPCPARAHKAKPGTAHAETCPAHGVSDRAVSERITRARERLTTVLVERGLIEEPRERREGKQKPRRERHRVAPVGPTFASEAT